VLRFGMICMSVLGSTLRVTWFSCMTNPKNCWGQARLTPCDMVLISCDMFYRKEPMNWKIMKGICLMSPKMGSSLKVITRNPSSLGVNFCILVYLSVYIYFPLCHRISYQVFPQLTDDNGVFNLLRIYRRC
jgi:hypothetical protein